MTPDAMKKIIHRLGMPVLKSQLFRLTLDSIIKGLDLEEDRSRVGISLVHLDQRDALIAAVTVAGDPREILEKWEGRPQILTPTQIAFLADRFWTESKESEFTVRLLFYR